MESVKSSFFVSWRFFYGAPLRSFFSSSNTLYVYPNFQTNRSCSLRLNWSECHVSIPGLKISLHFLLYFRSLPHFFLNSFHFMTTQLNVQQNSRDNKVYPIEESNSFLLSPKLIGFAIWIVFSFFIHRPILINTLRTSKMIFDSHRRGDRHDLFSITMIKLQKRQRRKSAHTWVRSTANEKWKRKYII